MTTEERWVAEDWDEQAHNTLLAAPAKVRSNIEMVGRRSRSSVIINRKPATRTAR